MVDATDAADVWGDFCARLDRLGRQVLAHETVTGDRERADGLRALSRQVVFALQDAVEFSDGERPALFRYDDDVTKWGGPNVDNNYLRCAVDPAGTYRLSGDVTGCREILFSLNAGDMQLGHVVIHDECCLSDLATDDGRLELTISPDQGPGDRLRSRPDTARLTIRVYVVDWDHDTVPALTIERLDGDDRTPRTLDVVTMAKRLDATAAWIEGSMPFWLDYMARADRPEVRNHLGAPVTPQGGAENIAYGGGFWDLGPDDALLVEFEPPTVATWSVQTQTFPWFESGDFTERPTSVNDRQAHLDADGRVRLVVSHRDPGVPNWIDTEGRPTGMLVYRWVKAATTPTPDSRLLRLDDLRAHLPSDHPVVGAEGRRQALASRRRAAQRRFRR
jgi:hypothetical protein